MDLPHIIKSEYFFDNIDNGTGNCDTLPIIHGDTIIHYASAGKTDSFELGNHVLTIRYADSLGRWSMNNSRPFQVCSIDGPIADFEIIKFGNSISFDNKSMGSDKYCWDFGDGIKDSVVNPIHTYTQSGEIYEVTLIVENICGKDTLVKQVGKIGRASCRERV